MSRFFSNPFSPKKTPPRRAHSLSNLNLSENQERREFGTDYGPVKLKLGGNEVTFENGQWIQASSGGAASHKEVIRLRKQNQQLLEENNLMKIKLDLLLDMLAETTAETHLQENEITELKTLMSTKTR